MVRPGALVASFAALGFVACSLSSGVDGLRGGDQEGPPSAGAGGGASGGGQGASQGGSGSGGGAAGATAGGGGAGEGGGAGAGGMAGAGGGACSAGMGFFCDNFEAPVVGESWTRSVVEGFGMGLSTFEPGNGSPRALRVTAESTDDFDVRSAMVRQLVGASASLRCEFDLFIEAYQGENVDLLTFDYVLPGYTNYDIAFVLNAEDAWLEVAADHGEGETFESMPLAMPPRGVWFRMALEVSSGKARVFYGTTLMVEAAVEATPPASSEIALGITWVQGGGLLDFRYDNLTCTN